MDTKNDTMDEHNEEIPTNEFGTTDEFADGYECEFDNQHFLGIKLV